MTKSWKDKVDNYLVEKARQEKERKESEAKNRLRMKQEEETRLYDKLGRKYKCCVCGERSKTPYQWEISNAPAPGSESHVDWEKPGDLFQCTLCHGWACKDHFYNGICQKCSEKL